MLFKLKKSWPFHFMVLPAVVLVLIFNYLPMAGLVISLQDYQPWLGIHGSQWVGLANFKDVFQRPDSVQVLKNTAFIFSFKIMFDLIVCLMMALMMNEIR